MSFLKKWESLTLLLLRCGLGLVFIYHGYPKLIPKHPMADAVDYTLGQWEALTVFTTDGAVPIDKAIWRSVRVVPAHAFCRSSSPRNIRAVMRYERERLVKRGRQDLADRVRWHAQAQEFVGWDITSFDDDGNECFIEVKSSVGKPVASVALTVNEWQAACDTRRRNRYYIYLVSNALSAMPSIERLRNPASRVEERQLSCAPIVYELTLSPPEEAS